MADTTNRIVTEIIVDSRAAEEGIAVVSAAMRAAQREFDKTIAKSRENTAANKAAAAAGKEVADVLTTTAGALRKAAAESQVYRGRLDPLVFAQNALGKELGNVGRALTGVDTLLVAGRIKSAEATKQVEEFKARQAELVGVMKDVKAGTISAADALTYLKTAAERAAEPVKAVAAATDSLRLKYDESYRSQKQYADATKRIFEELKTGNITRETAILGLKQETAALIERDAAAAKTKSGASDAEQERLRNLRAKWDDLYRAELQYKNTLASIAEAERTTGLAATTAAAQRAKALETRNITVDAFNKSAAGPSAADSAAEYQKLRSSIDPVYKLSKEYQAQVDHITESQKILKLSTEQLDQAYENARLTFEGQVNSLNRVRKGHEETDESMKKTGASVGQLKFANQQLTVQMSQFFSGIATGQPIMMTLIQQGHQVADVMWASGISMKEMAQGAAKMLGSALALLITPVGLLVTGLVAVAGAIVTVSVAAERANRRMGELQQQGSAVRDNYGQMAVEADKAAKAIARTTSISTADSRAITGALNKNINFTGMHQDMQVFANDIEKLSLAMGEDIPAASKRFSDSMESPSKGAEAMIGRLKGFTVAFADSLKAMEASGNYSGAFTALLEKQRAALEDVKKATTPLQEAHERLGKAFSATGQDGLTFIERIGQPFITALTAIENAIAGVIEKLQNLGQQYPTTMKALSYGMMAIPGIGPLYGGAMAGVTGGGGGAGPRAGTTPNEGSVTLTTKSGVKYTVRKDLAPQFQGFINDLEATGYRIYEMSSTRPGATVQGTGLPSRHGSDSAVDINPRDNAVGTEGNIGRALALGLAKKWGLTSGYLFKDTDPMHVGTDMQSPQQIIDNQRRITDAGATQYQGGGTITRRLEENTREQQKAQAALNLELEKYNKAVGEDNKEAMDIAATAGAKNLEVLEKLRGERVTILSTQQAETRNRENAIKGMTGEVGAQRDLNEARERYRVLGEEAGTGVDQSALFRAETAELAKLTIQFNDSVTAIDLQTQALGRQVPAMELGGQAAEFAANAEKAIEDARKTSLPNTEERIRQIKVETEALNAQSMAKRDNQAAQSVAKSNEQIEMLKVEMGLITATTAERDREVAVMQKRQELGLKISEQATPEQQKALDAARAVADMNTQFQISKQAVQEVGNMATQAFDQVGTAITNAFVGGQGAAVNFGNVAKAVMQSVLQQVVKLAVINPIMNSLLGGANRTTMDQVLYAYGAGGSPSVGGSSGVVGAQGAAAGGGGLLSQGGSVLSGGSSLFKMFGGGESLFSNASGGVSGLASFGNMPVSSLLSGNLSANGGAFLGAGQFGPVTSGLPAGGAGLPAAGTSVMGAAGGIAAGFALGTMAGQGIQGMRGTTGPAPMAGAAAGAIAGAVIGTIVPVIGTVIGAIVGGIIGGGAGGFIGPKKASPYSSTLIDITNGRASVGQTLGQGVDTEAERASIMDDVGKLNTYLDSTGLKLTGLGKLGQIGQNSPKGFQDPTKFGDIAGAFGELRFGSEDPTLNKYLSTKSFGDSEALQKTFKDYRDLVDNTIPSLNAFGKTTGSVNDSIKELNDAFNAGIARAKEYGIATEDLSKAQAAGEAKIREQANNTIASVDFQFRMRKRIAEGGDPQSIELDNFDQGAKEQRDAFKAQLVGLLGDAYTSTAGYAEQMKLLEDTLGAERAAIVKKYADIIVAQERQMRSIHDSLALREMNVSGASDMDKALFGFDSRARDERESFGDTLAGIYGEAYRKTEGYANEMKRLENVQGLERVAVVKQYTEALAAAERNLLRGDNALRVRLNNATPGDDVAKRLFAFDAQAQIEREDYSKSLIDVYGESYKTTVAYADRIALLEQTLGAERLQIVNESNDAIVQKTKDAQANAANAIQSLVQYATGLQTSDASPLSPQDKLTLSRDRFNAVSGAAAAGDYNSIQQLSGYADTFLSASREVYGSGAAYVGDFQRVLDVLGQVADVAPDTLTASVLATETRTQTAELVQELQNLKAAVDTVTTQLRQNQTAPARIAA